MTVATMKTDPATGRAQKTASWVSARNRAAQDLTPALPANRRTRSKARRGGGWRDVGCAGG